MSGLHQHSRPCEIGRNPSAGGEDGGEEYMLRRRSWERSVKKNWGAVSNCGNGKENMERDDVLCGREAHMSDPVATPSTAAFTEPEINAYLAQLHTDAQEPLSLWLAQLANDRRRLATPDSQT